MQNAAAPLNPPLPTLHAHKLSLSQITAAKAIFTKQLKQRAMDAVLAADSADDHLDAVMATEEAEEEQSHLAAIASGPVPCGGDSVGTEQAGHGDDALEAALNSSPSPPELPVQSPLAAELTAIGMELYSNIRDACARDTSRVLGERSF